eukprot:12547990-Ditylum_brightwellii.AAC.1
MSTPAGKISSCQTTLQSSKGHHLVDVWAKTTPSPLKHLLAKHDTIGLLVTSSTNRWNILCLPKVEAVLDVDKDTMDEFVVATANDNCVQIFLVKVDINYVIANFKDMVKLTSAQQKLVPVGQKLNNDNVSSCAMLEGMG